MSRSISLPGAWLRPCILPLGATAPGFQLRTSFVFCLAPLPVSAAARPAHAYFGSTA